jgi:hypothetical protein
MKQNINAAKDQQRIISSLEDMKKFLLEVRDAL